MPISLLVESEYLISEVGLKKKRVLVIERDNLSDFSLIESIRCIRCIVSIGLFVPDKYDSDKS